MRPSEMLREACNENWNAATQHSFCAELAAGTLPLEKMQRYLVQETVLVYLYSVGLSLHTTLILSCLTP